MLDSYQRVKMSVTVTKKTHFQDSKDPDEFDIIAADCLRLSLQYEKKKMWLLHLWTNVK